MVDLGSIPGWVKLKTIKIGFHTFRTWRSAIKRHSVKLLPCVIDMCAGGSLTQRTKGLSLSSDQDN